MDRTSVSAIIFVLMLGLSGCFGTSPKEKNGLDESDELYSIQPTWIISPNEIVLGDEATFVFRIYQEGVGSYQSEVTVISPTLKKIENYQWIEQNEQYQISFFPEEVGMYSITIEFSIKGSQIIQGDVVTLYSSLQVEQPVEPAPILVAPTQIMLEEPNVVWFEGSVTHQELATCSISYYITDGTTGSIVLEADGKWKMLLDFTEATTSHTITTTATCGRFTVLNDVFATWVYIEGAGNDADGDGIQDAVDHCPSGIGAQDGWKSAAATDGDHDGCRDNDEDDDDDNDGIIDLYDGCPTSYGWVSTPSADYDYDGCHDSSEDDDDDNDGVLDVQDSCPQGRKGWVSNRYSDWDNDGCSDLDEDDNDDNDSHEDAVDFCPKGIADWESNSSNDWDDDGCFDASEDSDDDNDSVPDVNGTGEIWDICPFTPLNAADVNEFGCAAIQRDSDEDGVNDLDDQCEGTPNGLVVNSLGCADIDDDGVFENVDLCPQSPERWSVNIVGCAVVQLPVTWTDATTLDGPMQIVPQFSFPTLNGSFNFKDRWTGQDVYFFLFKYTDGSGNTNGATWGQNPGRFIRNLPANTQLFFGSYDSSYHNDVIQQRNAVLAGLTSTEESYWDERIHYIDVDASNLGGGLGAMISVFNNPLYMGIDRFQLARETGSLYAWTSQSNDPFHLSHEPNQWVAEFPAKIRREDPAVHEISILDFVRHAGGWAAGFNTFNNATIQLPDNLSGYDTMEIFHEHACVNRLNRYQKSDGTYAGCHEWDYLANLYICEATNSSSCNTEVARWITTYGREGLWLTDISPYLFMLHDGETRRFRYAGANVGELSISLLFSNWGSGNRAVSGTYAFSGGQFDGTYNNESRYLRQLNFSIPSDTTRVEIVATITGHGFNKDTANCAEFCDHQHFYSIGSHQTYEWHPVVYSNEGCENEVANGVVANQFGSWPFGRAGWCPGQDVKQWRYDITDWIDNSTSNHLTYRGYYNGAEYSPSDGIGNGGREIRAVIWIIFYGSTTA